MVVEIGQRLNIVEERIESIKHIPSDRNTSMNRHSCVKYSDLTPHLCLSEGFRGEDSIAELYRREGINSNVYYRWSKEFLEAGKKRLVGDTVREATSNEGKNLRSEASAL